MTVTKRRRLCVYAIQCSVTDWAHFIYEYTKLHYYYSVCVCVCVGVNRRVRMCVSMCMYVWVCVCVCMSVYVCKIYGSKSNVTAMRRWVVIRLWGEGEQTLIYIEVFYSTLQGSVWVLFWFVKKHFKNDLFIRINTHTHDRNKWGRWINQTQRV